MQRIVRGYHGTTLAVASAIVSRQAVFEPSRTDSDHWLGYGVYFWEENLTRAVQWAYGRVWELARRGIVEQPAVIAADIDLTDCLDLCQPAWNDDIRRLGSTLAAVPRQHGPIFQSTNGTRVVVQDYEMPPESACYNHADSKIVDVLLAEVSRTRRVTSKRAAFQSGRQLHSNSYLFEEGHVQIAVIDLAVVKNELLISPPPMTTAI